MKNYLIKSKKVKIVSLILSFIFIFGIDNVNQNISSNFILTENTNNLNYTAHAAIFIDSDDDFVTYSFPGTGSVMDPFRIENLHISAASGQVAIEISFTTENFVIQNCLIEDSIIGIYLISLGPNTAYILDNSIKDNNIGIYLYDSDYTIIANNTMYNNAHSAMQIDYSAFVVLDNNTLTNGGIDFLYDNNFTTMIGTQCYNNTLNGKPIAWFVSEISLSLTSSNYGQIFLLDCNDVTVDDFVMKSPLKGIYVFYCDSVDIMNCYCGIEVTGSTNVVVANCRFDDKNLEVYKTTDGLIEDNKYDIGDFSVHIGELCSNLIIRNNLCKGRMLGIYVEMSTDCLIENNICENNLEYGLYLPMSDHITVRNNLIDRSLSSGIYLAESYYCEIYQNIVTDCSEHAINLGGWGDTSDNNRIYRNIFIDNNHGGNQGKDDGVGNLWYNSSTNKGNYWDDWPGEGEYSISGTASNSDPYPLEDTDADGMDPAWELDYELNPWIDDADEDPDDDDLTNLEEFNLKTNPRKNDTDNDGLEDGDEVNNYNTDPKNDDTDEDGLKDGEEVQIYFTNPLLNDTDGDGYLDGEEVENENDPLDPNDPKKTFFGIIATLIAVVSLATIYRRKK